MDHTPRLPPPPPYASSITFTPPTNPLTDVLPSQLDLHPQPDRSDPDVPLMKGPKRKRLAKACDACHRSKRRCDGTAPCSNCYFASKKCTYTDASGKPVPAPRPFNQDNPKNHSGAQSTSYLSPTYSGTSISLPALPIQANDAALSRSSSEDDRTCDPRAKRLRTELGNIPTPSGTPPQSLMPPLTQRDRPFECNQVLTRELVHLFFAYRQPQRMVIHQPSFLRSLSYGTVPRHLLLAVCAVAAPLSRQPHLRTSPCRYAGEVFAREAVSLMFDKNCQLVCERNLATAQALLLLQLHDRMGKSLWVAQHHQLALEIVTKLGIFDTDSTVPTPHPSPELIDACIERECARRVFWVIFISDSFGWMLYRRPRLATDFQTNPCLPIDETSFEISPLTAVPEFITKPTPSYSTCSESGQLIRLLLLHEEMERLVDDLNECESGRYPIGRLQEIEMRISGWSEALPEYMRFNDDNLWVHVTQYDTASNMGAWCFFIMHVVYCSCILALHLGKRRCCITSSSNPIWAQERILKVIEALGRRKAKSSIFLGVAIWPLFKYANEPPSQALLGWSCEFEEIWGVRIQDLSQRQLGQQMRMQLATLPPPPISRAHMPETPAGPTSSPVSRTGSDVSSSLGTQPSNQVPKGRMLHDEPVHSLSSPHSEGGAHIGHDASEKEAGSMVDDADIDPALQGLSDARLQAPSQWPVSAPPLSLPSLKASGLLEWPRSGSTDAVPSGLQSSANRQQPFLQHFTQSRQPQRDFVQSSNTQPADTTRPPASSVPSNMPVGLQWLAHESSAPRPS